MTQKTFPCIACGAPVSPYPGAERTVCSYCGSTATIPDDLRIPAISTMAPKPERNKPEINIPDVIETIQPMAFQAYNTFWLWTVIRRVLPGCLIALAILCVVACALTIGGFSIIQS